MTQLRKTREEQEFDDAFDERGQLKDGISKVRVPLKMMDSGGDVDWAAWDAALEKARQRDVAFPPVRDSDGRANLRQPGFTVAARVTDSARQAHRALYDQIDAEVSNAWRTPTGAGSRGQRGPRLDAACTVKFGGGKYGPEGSPGTWQLIDDQMVCVADGHDASAKRDGTTRDARDAAYAEYAQNLRLQYLRAR